MSPERAVFFCADCGYDTCKRHYYMLKSDLWKRIVPEDFCNVMLCLDCVEDRLGRWLKPSDFSDARVNAIMSLLSEDVDIRVNYWP